jgi:hypothetical protein
VVIIVLVAYGVPESEPYTHFLYVSERSGPLPKRKPLRAILIQYDNGTVGTDRWKQCCDGGWATNVEVCEWNGITCTADKANVAGINIAVCNLVGQSPFSPDIPSILFAKCHVHLHLGRPGFVPQGCLA